MAECHTRHVLHCCCVYRAIANGKKEERGLCLRQRLLPNRSQTLSLSLSCPAPPGSNFGRNETRDPTFCCSSSTSHKLRASVARFMLVPCFFVPTHIGQKTFSPGQGVLFIFCYFFSGRMFNWLLILFTFCFASSFCLFFGGESMPFPNASSYGLG